MTEDDYYDETIEMAAEKLQEEILSDREASYALMELALPISHRYDRDQQAVADDISASFVYRHGVSPDDYADSVRSQP